MDVYRERAIARTWERTRDPQCAPDPIEPEPEFVSGANAMRGERVVNRTTGQFGTVKAGTQFGRIIVECDNRAVVKWERTNTAVVR